MGTSEPRPESGSGRPVSPFHDRFLFRGHATGVSGHLRRDGTSARDVLWPAVGSVALPIAGGWARQEVENFELEDNGERLLRVGRVEVDVRGDFDQPPHSGPPPFENLAVGDVPTETFITTVIEDLTIFFNQITPGTPPVSVERIEVRWESRHTPGQDESEIHLAAAVHGLVLNGRALPVRPAAELLSERTYAGLKHRYRTDQGFRNRQARKLGGDPADPAFPGKRGGRDHHDFAMCRIFDDLAGPTANGVQLDPNGFAVRMPGFGSIYLGEMAISPADRRMTVLRMEVGSPRGGDLDVGDGGTNGSTWPP